MNTKNVILVTAIATVLLVAMVGSASAADCGAGTENACQCGDTVIGDWTFTADLTCTDTTTWGLKVGASNIVIDGAGYKITGNEDATVCYGASEGSPSAHSGIYNADGHDYVEIKNLEVENFCEGIALKYLGANKVTYNKVLDCSIHDNGNGTKLDPDDPYEETSTHGIHLVKAEYCTITRNDLFNNNGTGDTCSAGGNGFFAYGLGAGHNTITCNHAHNNRAAGIFLKKGGEFQNISYNNASGNGGAGISPKCKKVNNCTIEYNTVIGNGGHGFDSQAAYNTYRYNTVKDNGGDGIHIKAGHETSGSGWDYGVYNVITNNTICGHSGGSVDIWIQNDVYGWTNTVDKNTCDSPNNATAFACDDWKCTSLTTVYYDFDGDGYYSKDPADCTCNNILDVGSCCNPGLFNDTGAAQHCDGGVCIYPNPGTDPNDCDESIVPPVQPDLIITEKFETLDDGAFTVTYTVSNIGTGDAGASTTSLTTSDGQSASDLVPALNASESYTSTFGGFNCSCGTTITVTVCADSTSVIDESDETNNCLSNELTCPPCGLPDLDITDIWTDVKVGKKFNTTIIYYNITNNGDAKARRSVSNLSVDGIEQKKKDRVDPLAPGETLTRVFKYRGTPQSTITVCADYKDRIAESDETNNCLKVTST